MTSVKTKRRRPRKWRLLVWRETAVPFKNGERPMHRMTTIMEKTYTSQKAAMKSKGRLWKAPFKPFIRPPNTTGWKIVQLEVFPEDYRDE